MPGTSQNPTIGQQPVGDARTQHPPGLEEGEKPAQAAIPTTQPPSRSQVPVTTDPTTLPIGTSPDKPVILPPSASNIPVSGIPPVSSVPPVSVPPLSSAPIKTALPLEQQYMLAAIGQDNKVRGDSLGIGAGTVPEKQVTYAPADSTSQKFLQTSGSLLFETPLDLTKEDSEAYPLSLSDRIRRDIDSAWGLGKPADETAPEAPSYLRSAGITVKPSADKKSLNICDFRVEIAKDDKANPLVFTTLAETLNQQFEPTSATQSASSSNVVSGGSPNQLPKFSELSGLDRYSKYLLLGLDKASTPGGFSNLGDLCAVANITPKPWLEKILSLTKITFGSRSGDPARNAMWYLPGKESQTWIRLEASVDLNDALAGQLNKYLSGWSDKIPAFSAVAKRTHIASPEFLENPYTSGQLVLVANLKPKALDAYVEFAENEIHIILACFSTELQWDHLKKWLIDTCGEVVSAIGGLETTLSKVTKGSTKSDQSSTKSHIFWRKVSVSLRADPVTGKMGFAGLSIDLEASVQVLVQADSNAVFTLGFAWDKASKTFSGRCAFDGTGPLLKSTNPPLQYLQDYECWSHLSYLTPSVPYMSLRYLDNEIMQHLPFGIPTELTMVDLYVSNKQVRFGGELQALIGQPTSASTDVADGKIPSLQLSKTTLRATIDVNYAGDKKFTKASLFGEVGLVPLKAGDPSPTVRAMIEYISLNSALQFQFGATDIPMTVLHSLFWAGEEKTQAMSLLEHITLKTVRVTYASAKGQSPLINFESLVDISGIMLDTKFNRSDANTWEFKAELLRKTVNAGQSPKEFDLGAAIQKLLGPDVADVLPDFVKGTKLKTSTTGQDSFKILCKRVNAAKSLVFGAELRFGMLNVQFAQLAPLREKSKGTPESTIKPSAKRLIRVSLGPLPSIPKLPLVGQLDIPFDALEFLWLSSSMNEDDINTLNNSVDIFKDQKIAMSSGEKEIVEGFHFRLVGSKGVFLDHVFNHETEKKKDPKAASTTAEKTPLSAQSQPAQKTPQSPGVAPATGSATATTAPLAKKTGPLTLSGIALSYEGGTLRIHLDASVLIGPIGAGVQGLNLVLNLSKVKGLHDLLNIPIDVQIEGFDMSFDRKPVMLAGALHHKPGSNQYYGGVAITLSSFSIAALGMYDQIPATATMPAYDSFFVYAMAEGLLFTVGWAEVRGIIAGFGYNSRLRLPTVDQLTNFPLIQGFTAPGGFNMNDAITSLTGRDAFVTPSMGSLWLALGLVIRACEAIDMRAVATVALGPDQTEIGLIARATASLPRGAKPSDALVVIDLSVVGKLDLVHGELSVDGQINPTSFILNKDCRPSGGFAIRTWFGKGSPYAGDWVVTFGGYHPMYQVPAHYPIPKRLGISWNLSSNLKITGNAYAAVTPGAIMAGGMLQAVFSAGPFGAHFDAHADFLVNLKPLHYEAEIAISAGVYYEIRVWCIRKKISVNVGASLHLEGPPIHGKVHFDLCVVSFDVSFGSGESQAVRAIKLCELMDLVLQNPSTDRTKPQDTIADAHTFTVISGLIGEPSPSDKTKEKKTSAKKDPWIVRSDNFLFQIRSPVPVSTALVKGEQQSDSYKGKTIISRPMGMKAGGQGKITTTMEIEIQKVGQDKALPFQRIARIDDDLPANYWGAHADNPAQYMRPTICPSTVNHLVGVTLQPPPARRSAYSAPVFKAVAKEYDPTSWHPQDLTSASTRYVNDHEARDSVKWSRVRGAMAISSADKIRAFELESMLDEEPAKKTKAADVGKAVPAAPVPVVTTTPKFKRSKHNKPRRQGILDFFVRVAHAGDDGQSKNTADAYCKIGAAIPRVVLHEPERFYVSPPTVFCQ